MHLIQSMVTPPLDLSFGGNGGSLCNNPTSPLGAGGLDDSSSFCVPTLNPPEPWGRVYPTPYPLPRGLRQRCVVDSRVLKTDFGEIRPISKIYCKIQYEMAFLLGKNGPRGATVSETFLLALEIMLKTDPSAPTFSVGASKRPPRGLKQALHFGFALSVPVLTR